MKRWWLKLARYAVPQWKSWTLVLLLMVLGAVLGLLAPWPLKLIVDYVVPQRPLPAAVAWLERLLGSSAASRIGWLAAATVMLFLLRRAASIVQEYVETGAGSRMVYDLAGDLFMELQRRPVLFHNRHHTGDLVRRVTADTTCVRELVTSVCLPLLKSAVIMALMFFIMWQMSPPLALLAIGLAVPLGVLVQMFARSMSDKQFQQWERQGEIAAFAEQTLTALPIVQAFGREKLEDRRFQHLAGRTVQATLRAEVAQHWFKLSTGTVNAAATAVVMLFGGLAVLHSRLTVGDLLVLISYFAALYSPIETLAYLSEGFASAGAGARRVLGVLESGEAPLVDRPDARPFPEATPQVHLRFENVTFGYDPQLPVLHEVSFQVGPGEIVALAGATGAGKSTLAGLALRFFDPQQGAVYFNDVDAREIQIARLRKRIGYVPQEPFLLPLSIAENIAFGRPDANREEIIAAASSAGADGFIRDLPRGYDTVIGDRGVTLSGGEKQRLSIARALLTGAPVLVLDEPTSALDGDTEQALLATLRQIAARRTVLMIAHRPSTIRAADRVVVLQQGRVAQQGTQDELLAGEGTYSRLLGAGVQAAGGVLSPGKAEVS
jgi:ATP-binding cassette subfamily B protein